MTYTRFSALGSGSGGGESVDLSAYIKEVNGVTPDVDGAVSIDKVNIGLGSVDNTTDLGKPVSTATTTQLNLKAPLASPAFTGTPTGLTKAHVGLSSVDNTADANKPTTAAVTALLAGKAATSHTHTMANITDLAAALTAITDRLTALEAE